jgi:hypothetical protein
LGSLLSLFVHLALSWFRIWDPSVALFMHFAYNHIITVRRLQHQPKSHCTARDEFEAVTDWECPPPVELDPTFGLKMRGMPSTTVIIEPTAAYDETPQGSTLPDVPVVVCPDVSHVRMHPCKVSEGMGCFGITTGTTPVRERGCVHNVLIASLKRRGAVRPPVVRQVYVEFLAYIKAFCDPIRQYVAAHFPPKDHLTLFEEWVTRPGRYSPARQAQFREALLAYYTDRGDPKMWDNKVFIKVEAAMKRPVKPRLISGLSDTLSALVGPYTVPVAELVKTYLDSTGWIHWVKDSLTRHGQIFEQCMMHSSYVHCTDGSNWDKNHLPSTLRAVDVFTHVMPKKIRTLWHKAGHRAVGHIAVKNHREYATTYKSVVGGSIYTGQPDVSLSNTLIRLCLDLFANGVQIQA